MLFILLVSTCVLLPVAYKYYGSTFVSIRNKGKSIAEVSKELIGPWTGRLFMVFVLSALIYVLIVFLDLTAENFIAKPAVATASSWFVVAVRVRDCFPESENAVVEGSACIRAADFSRTLDWALFSVSRSSQKRVDSPVAALLFRRGDSAGALWDACDS